ncbi:MAG: shikimate dehydrogenase [Anaerolineae bacterium]|nr:shikimate dehydrogenase [Anaerolineae bacterium]
MAEKRVGVMGWPVAHSISPAMHNAAFQALNMIDWKYDLLPIPPDIVRQSLRTLREEGGYTGVNVTVPHKQAVMPYVRPDEIARVLGAANTIDFRENRATNTDVEGLVEDLKAHGVVLDGAKVLVLGAGGAARAAVYGLTMAGAVVTVTNRTFERAQVMLADLTISAGIQTTNFKPLPEAALEDDYTLVLNCTPVGMWPHVDACPWPDGVPFLQGVTVYDMIYRPQKTRLMEKAELHDGRAIGGLGMLVRQGAASFRIWTGEEPPIGVMLMAAEAALTEKTSEPGS